MRGFWEAGIILENEQALTQVQTALSQLEEDWNTHKELAGMYNLDWKGDHRFICSPGHCQLAILFAKAGNHFERAQWIDIAHGLIQTILPAIRLKGNKNKIGALPGSIPIWGPYMRGKYPNWAAKFFLDAIRTLPTNP